MAIRLKSKEDIDILREGGKRHAFILNELAAAVAPGVSTKDLDDLAARLIAEHAAPDQGGDKAAFLGYKPYGAKRPYPASLCVSVNDAVVHGIPNEEPYILREGDIVSLDLGLIHRGMVTDMAVTVPVGKIAPAARDLLKATKKALDLGIKAAKPGNTIGHIGAAIEGFIAPQGYGIVEELAGHGVGYGVHEDPYVPNYGVAGEGDELVPGMVIAIEPIINEGTAKIFLDKDGYTYRTRDGKSSAHFEHTLVITSRGAEVLTKL
ncbi:MAG: type I methionyl aminopeptidase [Patescibacteria group bacterium]|nr:type I methionyl aminopeptidase [Patescibacteria group bacterium]MDE2116680.1 type I methionyl aminopeptidase [Patescibacteria group bacterium]